MPATPAVNYWPDNKCAKAFWGQHELPPYREPAGTYPVAECLGRSGISLPSLSKCRCWSDTDAKNLI